MTCTTYSSLIIRLCPVKSVCPMIDVVLYPPPPCHLLKCMQFFPFSVSFIEKFCLLCCLLRVSINIIFTPCGIAPQDDYTEKLRRILFMLTKRKSLQSEPKTAYTFNCIFPPQMYCGWSQAFQTCYHKYHTCRLWEGSEYPCFWGSLMTSHPTHKGAAS